MAKSVTRYDEAGNAVIREARPASNVRTAPRDVKAKGAVAVAAWNKANRPQPGKTGEEAMKVAVRGIMKQAADKRAKKTIASTARSFTGGTLSDALSANNTPKVAPDAPVTQKRAAVASGMAARAANRVEAGSSDGGPKRRAAERFARIARGESPFGRSAPQPRTVTAADFDFSKAPQYRKTARLAESQIAVAKGGEEIVTRQPDGKGGSFVETKRTAKAGDRIVTRTPGDSYVISSDKWDKLYEKDPAKPGEYRSRNTGRAVRVKEDVQIKAPWGEMQTIKKGGVIFKSDVDGSVYGNQKDTFGADFKPEKSTRAAKSFDLKDSKFAYKNSRNYKPQPGERAAAIEAFRRDVGRDPPKSWPTAKILGRRMTIAAWGDEKPRATKGDAVRAPKAAAQAAQPPSFIDKVNAAAEASAKARKNAPKPPVTPPGPRDHWGRISAKAPAMPSAVDAHLANQGDRLASMKTMRGAVSDLSAQPQAKPVVTNDSAMGMKPPITKNEAMLKYLRTRSEQTQAENAATARSQMLSRVNTGLAVVGTGVAAAQAFRQAKESGASTGNAIASGAVAAAPGALLIAGQPVGSAMSRAGGAMMKIGGELIDEGTNFSMMNVASNWFLAKTGLATAGAGAAVKVAGEGLKIAGKVAAPAMAAWGAYQGAKEDDNKVRGAVRGAMRSLDPSAIVTGIGAGTGLMKDGRGLGERAYDAVFGGPTQGRVSAVQAQTFAKADANYDHMGQGQPQVTGERPGWSPEARIAAAQARGAVNLPYGGDPTQAPGYQPPTTPKGKRPY